MKIHYFQRYHNKENVDTGNTLLLLSRLYSHSAHKFFIFLKTVLLSEQAEPELVFKLQEKREDSIPDATLTQESYKIVIETKLSEKFSTKQLRNHLTSFNNEKSKVIATLSPEELRGEILSEFKGILLKYNKKNKNINDTAIVHKHLTFEDIIKEIREILTEQDYEFSEILDDYEEYCYSQSLIKDGWKKMRAIVAGTTLEINKKLNLYYDNAERGFSSHDYLGLYSKKAVRAIGKICNTVIAKPVNGKIEIIQGNATNEQKMKIKAAIEDSVQYGYNLVLPRIYFFVEKFYETLFRKNTPYPIQKTKFFDLTEILDSTKLPSTDKIAELLKNKEW
jgi:hypothetical protein